MSVAEALAGNRTAVNLQGLEKEEVERGMVVAPPGALLPSRRLDAFLEILPSAPRPLKHRQAVRLHTGTSERIAMPLLLDADDLPPGASGYVQFFLREPLALKPGDRLVIRCISPAFTWGGGQVLHVNPPRHRRRQEALLAKLATLEKGAPEQILPRYLEEAGAAGRSREELTALLPWDPGDLTALLNSLIKQGQAINYDPEKERYILTATARELKQEISGNLSAYHRKNPMKPGLSKEELRTQLPARLEVRLFNQLLNDLVQKQQIVLEKDLVRLASHRVTLGVDQEEHVNRLAALYQRGQLSPPTLKEAAADLAVTPGQSQAAPHRAGEPGPPGQGQGRPLLSPGGHRPDQGPTGGLPQEKQRDHRRPVQGPHPNLPQIHHPPAGILRHRPHHRAGGRNEKIAGGGVEAGRKRYLGRGLRAEGPYPLPKPLPQSPYVKKSGPGALPPALVFLVSSPAGCPVGANLVFALNAKMP